MNQQSGMMKTIAESTQYIFLAFAVLFPLFFLPITADAFETNKKLLLFLCAAALLVFWIVKTVASKAIRITTSPVLFPAVLFCGATIASTFIANQYRYTALTGRTLIVCAATVLFLAASALINMQKQRQKWLFYAISIPGLVLSVFSVLQVMGFGLPLFLNKAFGTQIQNTILFQLSGSMLASMSIIIPLFLAHVFELFATKDMKDKTIHSIFAGVLLAGIIVNGFFMTPGKEASIVLLPFSASWSIALDALKSVKLAVFGVGPDAYIDAFNQFRPAAMNLSSYWTVRFASARTELFHQLTTIGVLGAVAWILLQLSFIRLALPLKEEHRGLSILLLGIVAYHLLFPATIISLVGMYLVATAIVILKKTIRQSGVSDIMLHVFAFQQVDTQDAGPARPHQASQVLAYVLSVVLSALLVVATLAYQKVYASELTLFQSLVAAQKNNIQLAYQLQAKATLMQPKNDAYHRAFASTNFYIASAISQNKDATEQEKQNIAPLLQQSIQAARTAAELNPRGTTNWETLASIYRELIGIAQGAEQWTVSAFVRAIQTDPSNATLRYELGNVYMRLQNPDQAAQLYRQAIELKSDWPNAYYNLSQALLAKGDKVLALDAMQQASALLPENHADKVQLDKNIATLKTEVDALIKQQQEQQAAQQKTQNNKQTNQGTAPQDQQSGIKDQSEPALPQGEIKIPENLGLPEETPPVSVPTTDTNQ